MAKNLDDPTKSEDHFGRHNAARNSGWTSVMGIVVIAVILGAVFYFH